VTGHNLLLLIDEKLITPTDSMQPFHLQTKAVVVGI
jgi:hypothetical protein